MKTFEDVLDKALLIASLDKNARVAVFDLRIRQKVSDNSDKFNTGVFQAHTMRYIDESGGEVLFFDAGREVWPACAGYQFTHVFCSEHVSREDAQLLKSRIRSAQEIKPEPMGFYNFYGVVERWSAW